MKKININDIQLVITAALKKEIPKEWFNARNIPVHTLAAVKAGAIESNKNQDSGILILITGIGLNASEEAVIWIRDNLSPFFVLNLGTCGIADRKYPIGKWLRPRHVSNEDGKKLELDMRLPIPCSENFLSIDSLLSVEKAVIGDIPEPWKDHDAIDMECYAQAKVFSQTDTSFHCIKFGTDYSDHNTSEDFNKNLILFIENIKGMFSFLDEKPSITAIVPVYNRENTIKRAIDSILSQSCPPEEIIIVDDASTDKTVEILKSYGDKITCMFLPENSGPSAARNEGIKSAGTNWITFLDSDDSWENDKLKNQIAYLEKYPFYEILQSDEIWIRNGKRVNSCKHHKKPSGWIWEASLERCLVSPSGVLLKKSLLERYGNFDEELPVCEDYDLWLKISRYHPVGLDTVMSVIKYGGHKDQLSGSYKAMDRFRVTSLYRILRNEPEPAFRHSVINVLEKKLHILITGYRKRDKSEDAETCEKILASLSSYL